LKLYSGLIGAALRYRIFKDGPDRKRPLWKPLWRWDDNIKMYLDEIR
jgi:hypothetical protein